MENQNQKNPNISGSFLSKENVASSIELLKGAFPYLTEAFYTSLMKRMIANKVTDNEFTNAVNAIVDTYDGIYPPKIGNFLNYIKENRDPVERPVVPPSADDVDLSFLDEWEAREKQKRNGERVPEGF